MKVFLKKIFIVLVAIILNLALAEAILQLNSFFVFKWREHQSMNKIGSESGYRILCLGDCLTYGYGLKWRQSYPEQLEKILNLRCPENKFKVINQGKFLLSPSESLVDLDLNLKRYHPDIVVLMFPPDAGWYIDPHNNPKNNISAKINRFLMNIKLYKLYRIMKSSAFVRSYALDDVKDYIRTDNGLSKIQCLIEMGRYYRAKEKYREAEIMYKEALKLDPDDGWAHLELARCYQLTKRYQDAEIMYKITLKLMPANKLVYSGLIKTYRAQKKYQEADMFIQKIVNAKEQITQLNHNAYREMQKILNKHKIYLILLTVPSFDDTGSRELFLELANSRGAVFIDIYQEFKKSGNLEKYFFSDLKHCNYNGNKLIAKTVAKNILRLFCQKHKRVGTYSSGAE